MTLCAGRWLPPPSAVTTHNAQAPKRSRPPPMQPTPSPRRTRQHSKHQQSSQPGADAAPPVRKRLTYEPRRRSTESADTPAQHPDDLLVTRMRATYHSWATVHERTRRRDKWLIRGALLKAASQLGPGTPTRLQHALYAVIESDFKAVAERFRRAQAATGLVIVRNIQTTLDTLRLPEAVGSTHARNAKSIIETACVGPGNVPAGAAAELLGMRREAVTAARARHAESAMLSCAAAKAAALLPRSR